jgi:hypothetical protein
VDRKEVNAAETEDRGQKTEDRRQKKWPVRLRFQTKRSPAQPDPDVNSAHPGKGLFHYIAEEETMQIWRY